MVHDLNLESTENKTEKPQVIYSPYSYYDYRHTNSTDDQNNMSPPTNARDNTSKSRIIEEEKGRIILQVPPQRPPIDPRQMQMNTCSGGSELRVGGKMMEPKDEDDGGRWTQGGGGTGDWDLGFKMLKSKTRRLAG